MYTLSTNMYLKGTKMVPLGTNMYLLKSSDSDSFCPFISESVSYIKIMQFFIYPGFRECTCSH